MLEIPCPWCGLRDETEFSYGGEAHIVRPKDPYIMTDEAWADYLFMRENTRGLYEEQWCHSAGCRRWFPLTRDTVTSRIAAAPRISPTSS